MELTVNPERQEDFTGYLSQEAPGYLAQSTLQSKHYNRLIKKNPYLRHILVHYISRIIRHTK